MINAFFFLVKAVYLKLKVYDSNHILLASFHIHSGGVERPNDKNCVTVQIIMDMTVHE